MTSFVNVFAVNVFRFEERYTCTIIYTSIYVCSIYHFKLIDCELIAQMKRKINEAFLFVITTSGARHYSCGFFFIASTRGVYPSNRVLFVFCQQVTDGGRTFFVQDQTPLDLPDGWNVGKREGKRERQRERKRESEKEQTALVARSKKTNFICRFLSTNVLFITRKINLKLRLSLRCIIIS